MSMSMMESTGIEYPPLKLKLYLKHKMLMLNICGVNVWFQDAPADLRHISLIYIIYIFFSADHSLKKTDFKKQNVNAEHLWCQCMVSGCSCGPSPYIFDIYNIYLFFSGPQFEKNRL